MRRGWRWAVVGVAVAALAATPAVVAAWPVGTSTVDPGTLLARVRQSAGVAYSGYAQSDGGLSLPVSTGAFTVNDLLGGTTRLRVWWRGSTDWRVDSIDPTGETDLHQDASGLWTWDYEANDAQRVTGATQVRLPRADDLVPGNLARRLVDEIRSDEVTRLPDRRIAGHDAAGLRVRVTDRRTTIKHIDVWALVASGLPMRVAVYGNGPTPVVSTSMLDVELSRPSAQVTAFHPSGFAVVRSGGVADIVSAIDRFGNSTPPARLAGLARRSDLRLGAVGVYGRAVTLLVAIPLSARLAGDVVPQLRKVPGVKEDDDGIAVGIGPVNLQLSPPTGFGARWLLVGTLTAAALRDSVAVLPPVQGFGFYR